MSSGKQLVSHLPFLSHYMIKWLIILDMCQDICLLTDHYNCPHKIKKRRTANTPEHSALSSSVTTSPVVSVS